MEESNRNNLMPVLDKLKAIWINNKLSELGSIRKRKQRIAIDELIEHGIKEPKTIIPPLIRTMNSDNNEVAENAKIVFEEINDKVETEPILLEILENEHNKITAELLDKKGINALKYFETLSDIKEDRTNLKEFGFDVSEFEDDVDRAKNLYFSQDYDEAISELQNISIEIKELLKDYKKAGENLEVLQEQIENLKKYDLDVANLEKKLSKANKKYREGKLKEYEEFAENIESTINEEYGTKLKKLLDRKNELIDRLDSIPNGTNKSKIRSAINDHDLERAAMMISQIEANSKCDEVEKQVKEDDNLPNSEEEAPVVDSVQTFSKDRLFDELDNLKDSAESCRFLKSNKIRDAIENDDLEHAQKMIKIQKDKLPVMKKMEKEIVSLEKKENMIDTRRIESAMGKGDIEKAKNELEKLKDDFAEYKDILKKLERLANRRTSLAEQLADGKINKDIYKDATQSITHREVDLEGRLNELRKKVIYEDYEKPF